jgi:CBS domain-containing protein
LNEVERFLASYPPFDGLPPDDLARVAGAVQVEFFPPGAVILHQLGAPSEFLYVVRTGGVEILSDGAVIDRLEEGEVFGFPSLLSGAEPTATVRSSEDTLCYLIPRDSSEEVMGTPSGLAFFAASLRRFLDRATRRREEEAPDPRLVPVSSLIDRPPLTCDPSVTVREAAALMARERASSILVRSRDGYGIVTDRDLRSKVVAEGLSYDRPVEDVMTHPVRSVTGDTLIHEAILEMLDNGIHHLPVLDEKDNAVGMLTDTDVLGLERRRPFLLRTEIERAGTPDEVAALGRTLPRATATLARAGVDAVDVGHIVALIVDSLTRRFLQLAADELGPAPAAWAWLALGSEARREQALATDQDHALAFADGAEEHDGYFRALAERVTEGLEGSGIPRCRAAVLASERAWRRPLSEWEETFDRWMQVRAAEPVALTTIAFDYRAIAGPLEVKPVLDRAVRGARNLPAFLRRLTLTALDFKPPLGFRGEVRGGRIDLKRGGLLPVIDLARLLALQAGSAVKPTIDRLRAAGNAGVIEAEEAGVLEEAYRVVLDARLAHQAAQVERDEAPDNLVDPSSMGRIERTRLKDAFRSIAEVQRGLSRRVPPSRIA